jgi:CRP-like cAMP-binding protein
MNDGLLSNFEIFKDMAQHSLKAIAQKSDILKLKTNDVIFRMDEPAGNFYGLIEGEVQLIITFKQKALHTEIEYEEAITARHEILEKPIIIDTIHSGEVFGWSSLVAQSGRWTVTAQCSKPSSIIALPASSLKAIFDDDPKLGYIFLGRLMKIISKRFHHVEEKLIDAWGEAFDVHP